MKSKKPFQLEVHKPFSTFTQGAPTPIPFVIDGLLPKAAFSVLGGKAKHGKSSMSRIEAVCVAKGIPFLDRPSGQGEVLLCSLEDPRQHIDNCLNVLEYDPSRDAEIHIVDRLSRDIDETVDAIARHLSKYRNIKLVILDTLAKVIRAKDIKDYSEMLELCEKLHLLARESGVHIQALAHCKKLQPEDPFDGFLGSAEIRAETDTNIVLYDNNRRRFIQSETRMGMSWTATEITAELATIGKSQVVRRFSLGETLESQTAERTAANEKNTRTVIKSRIVAALRTRGGTAPMADVIDAVEGRGTLKYEIRDELIAEKLIRMSGVAHSKVNPLQLTLLPQIPTPEPEPVFASSINICKSGDCTNDVVSGNEFCYRHQVVPQEGVCAN